MSRQRKQSASKVIRAEFRLLADEKESCRARAERVRQMIEAGARELDHGEMVDGEEVFRRLRIRRERRRKRDAVA